ncbi:SUKH-3 domain-containing protein [Glycomyces sp. MUSA5-2]|uniref:SUKH-3 domain-containing protein n=1 Tax=Glycomyces sp. MUSA5-2 TaxID=2053002 RepID=UPI003FA5F74A
MWADPFSLPTLRALHDVGWSEDRQVDITPWMNELEPQGFISSSVSKAALSSFGGIEIPPLNTTGPNFSNDEALVVDPILAGSGHHVLADELSEALGGDWFPFAEWMSGSSVFIDRTGRVVATGMDWVWHMGVSVNEAIEFVVRAHQPLSCISVLRQGVAPWPPLE